MSARGRKAGRRAAVGIYSVKVSSIQDIGVNMTSSGQWVEYLARLTRGREILILYFTVKIGPTCAMVCLDQVSKFDHVS